MQVALSDLHKLELEIEVKTVLCYFISTPVSLFAYIIALFFFFSIEEIVYKIRYRFIFHFYRQIELHHAECCNVLV